MSFHFTTIHSSKQYLVQDIHHRLGVQVGWESSVGPLVVPLFYPSDGAQGVEVLLEKFAGFVIFAFNCSTAVVINVILPAVPKIN